MTPWKTLIAALALWPTMTMAASFTDDTGRTVEVPDTPRRIVSVYDIDVTIPLIELGVTPVGSHGRIGPDGQPTLRSAKLLVGVDFDNSDIAFIGANTVDLEAIVALKPDLIITELSRPTPVDQLQKIAPTVVLDNKQGAPHLYRQLAALVNAEPQLARLEARYQAQIEQLKQTVTVADLTVSVMQPLRGKISVYHTYRALGQVLRDAGFAFAPLIEQIPENDRIEVGPERLPELDADVIFDPYRSDQGNGIPQELEMLEAIMPGFCGFLSACRNGKYVMVPREAAISNSYAGLGQMVSMVMVTLAPAPTAQ